MNEWIVTVQIQVKASNYDNALNEAESVLHNAIGFLIDAEDYPFEVITAEEKKEEE